MACSRRLYLFRGFDFSDAPEDDNVLVHRHDRRMTIHIRDCLMPIRKWDLLTEEDGFFWIVYLTEFSGCSHHEGLWIIGYFDVG